MAKTYHFGVVGLGQLGSKFATDLVGKALQTVSGFDPYISKERSDSLIAEGVTIIGDADDLSVADYVLIAVPHSHSCEAVRIAASGMSSHGVLIDLTTADADSKKAVAQEAVKVGKHYVDGAVLGPAADGIAVPIILSGAKAARVAEDLSLLGFRSRAVGEEVGDASSIKVVRSVLAKGLEALYVEGLLSARRLGIQDAVFETFCAMLDARSAADMAELLVTTHAMHAQRRCDEVNMSISTLESTGIPLHITRAVLAVFKGTIDSNAQGDASGQPRTLNDALAALDRARNLYLDERK